MKSIWKYRLPLTSVGTIRMQRNATVLKVDKQQESLCLWAMVDTEADTEEVTFTIVGTGHKFSTTLGTYVGTVLVHNDSIVLHVFKH